MATIVSNIPSTVFPWEVDTLRISSTEDTTLKLVLEGTAVFEATLTPTSAGIIDVYGLALVLQDALPVPFNAPQTLHFLLDGETDATCDVLYQSPLGSVPASDFTADSFLTAGSGRTKIVREDSTEALSWYATAAAETGEESVTVDAVWYNPVSLAVQTTTQQIQCTDSGSIDRVDVSPSRITPPDTDNAWRLSSYTVTLGRRTASYSIVADGRTEADALSVKFYNMFGQLDTFHFLGQTEEELKPTYNAATIGGRYLNYRIEVQPSFIASTGALSDAGEKLFADLLASTDIWRATDGVQLTLTDCSFKPSTAWGASPSGTATFRESLTGMRLNPSMPTDTFDSTFDETYE